MRTVAFLAALLLPLLWAVGSWVSNDRAIGSGNQWVIPITGYDPRDVLRGQYVAFTYAWDVKGSGALCADEGCDLCLSRRDARVVATIVAKGTSCDARVDPKLSGMQMNRGLFERRTPQFSGRIFVSERSAPLLEEKLRAGPMAVEAVRTPEGRLVSRRIINLQAAPGENAAG